MNERPAYVRGYALGYTVVAPLLALSLLAAVAWGVAALIGWLLS